MVDDVMFVFVICEVFDEVYLFEFGISEVVIVDILVIKVWDVVVNDYFIFLFYFKGFYVV